MTSFQHRPESSQRELVDGKRKYHTNRHSGSRAAVIRNPVFSKGCWIPDPAFSRPGMTTFLFRFNKNKPVNALDLMHQAPCNVMFNAQFDHAFMNPVAPSVTRLARIPACAVMAVWCVGMTV